MNNQNRLMIEYLKSALECEKKRVINLREQLQVEQDSAKIERIMHIEEVNFYKIMIEKISEEYVPDHGSESSDGDDESN